MNYPQVNPIQRHAPARLIHDFFVEFSMLPMPSWTPTLGGMRANPFAAAFSAALILSLGVTTTAVAEPVNPNLDGPMRTLAPEPRTSSPVTLKRSTTHLISGTITSPRRSSVAGATVHLIQFHHEQGKDVAVGQQWPTTTLETTTADEHGNYAFSSITRELLTKRSATDEPLNFSVKALTAGESGSSFFSMDLTPKGEARLSSSPNIVMEQANRIGSGTIPLETRSRTRGCDYTLKVRGGPVWSRINLAYINGDIGTSQFTFGTNSTSELGVGASVDFRPGVTLSQRGTNKVSAKSTLKFPKYGRSSDASTQFQWNLFEEYCRIPTSGGPVSGYYSLVASPVGWYPASAHARTNTTMPQNYCLNTASGMVYTYDSSDGRLLEREAKINLSGGGFGIGFQASEKTDYQVNGILEFTTGRFNGKMCGLNGYPYDEFGSNPSGAIMLSR